ncbi:MAG: hypothetical protein WDN67_05025 [Candidatus Moraniibacteriota bacterium]
MPSPQLPNYLRSHRKRLALSQDDVAFLLGLESGAKVCRDERFQREPSLQAALAYEAIFQTPVRVLFAGMYRKEEDKVVERAKTLRFKVALQTITRHTERKLESAGRLAALAEAVLNPR